MGEGAYDRLRAASGRRCPTWSAPRPGDRIASGDRERISRSAVTSGRPSCQKMRSRQYVWPCLRSHRSRWRNARYNLARDPRAISRTEVGAGYVPRSVDRLTKTPEAAEYRILRITGVDRGDIRCRQLSRPAVLTSGFPLDASSLRGQLRPRLEAECVSLPSLRSNVVGRNRLHSAMPQVPRRRRYA